MNAPWSIALQYPAGLLLLPLCGAVFLLLRRIRPWTAFAEARLLPWLIPRLIPRRIPGAAHDGSRRLIVTAWLLIAVAVSGPYLTAGGEKPARPALDIALVMDISPSMTANDLAPDRLQRARLEAYDLLHRLGGNRVALIAYSGYAYRVLPLTHDLPLVRGHIEALDPTLTRHHGSNLVQALEFAAQALTASADGGRAIILLSDGESTDGAEVMATAERFTARGIPVFALGVGTTAGAPVSAGSGHIRRPDGSPVVSRLDRALLTAIAARSGGRYADVRSDDADSAHLLAGIARLTPQHPGPATPAGYPLHPWLLAAALVLLLLGGRRYRPPSRTLASALVFAITFAGAGLPDTAFAAGWEERAAHRALQDGDYDRAATLYESIGGYTGHMGAGAAAYRRGAWMEARALYQTASALANDDTERALAYYNEANALARMGQVRKAIARLDAALALHPNHVRAALNRDLLQRALERKEARIGEETILPRIDDGVADSGAAGSIDTTAASASHSRGEAGATPDPSDRPALPETASAILAADAEETPARAMPLRTAGDTAALAAGTLRDDPREVLRHRFMVMDANRVRLPEPQTW